MEQGQDNTPTHNPTVTLADRLNRQFGKKPNNNNFIPTAPSKIPMITKTPASAFMHSGNNNMPDTLQQHLTRTKPLVTDTATSLADFLRKHKKEDILLDDCDQQPPKNANFMNNIQLNPVMTNAEAFKPVGTGVVALARTTGGSYTEEKQISPIPLHHSSTPSDLTSAICYAKRDLMQTKLPPAKKFKANEHHTIENLVKESTSDDLFPPLPLPRSYQESRGNKQNNIKPLHQIVLQLATNNLHHFLDRAKNLDVLSFEKLLNNICTYCPEKLNEHTAKFLYAKKNLENIYLQNTSHFNESVLLELLKIVKLNSPGASKFHFSNSTEVSNAVLQYMSENFSSIQLLDLGKCFRISDAGVKSMIDKIHTHHLQYFSISCCYLISSDCIRLITDSLDQQISHLQHLDLSYCQYIDDFTLALLIKQCPSLNSINLEYATSLTTKAVRAIAKYCAANLSLLNVNGMSDLNDETLICLAKQCANLVELQIAGCIGITSNSIEVVAKLCNSLEILNIYNCSSIDNRALFYLAGYCTKLTSLNLSNTMTNSNSVNSLLSRCTSLKTLNLGNTQIDNTTLDYLLVYGGNILELDLSFCHKLTADRLVLFACKCYAKLLILWGHVLTPTQLGEAKTVNTSLDLEGIFGKY